MDRKRRSPSPLDVLSLYFDFLADAGIDLSSGSHDITPNGFAMLANRLHLSMARIFRNNDRSSPMASVLMTILCQPALVAHCSSPDFVRFLIGQAQKFDDECLRPLLWKVRRKEKVCLVKQTLATSVSFGAEL